MRFYHMPKFIQSVGCIPRYVDSKLPQDSTCHEPDLHLEQNFSLESDHCTSVLLANYLHIVHIFNSPPLKIGSLRVKSAFHRPCTVQTLRYLWVDIYTYT